MKKTIQVITLVSALALVGLSLRPAYAVTKIGTFNHSDEMVEMTTSTDTQTSETSTNTSNTSDSTENKSTEITESTNATDDTPDDSNQSKAVDPDEQATLNAIGKGDNFHSRLYLNYFGGKLDTLFTTTSEDGFNFGFLMLYSEQLNLAKTQFEVDPLVVKRLMSTYLLYDIAFAKDSHFMSLLVNNDGTSPSEYTGFYPNTLPLEGTALNNQTGKNMNLKAYYVDQHSDKTVIIHGGFRGNWDNGVVTPEYDSFYQAGYNLLFVDSRTTGGSDGDFITYGQYESDDVLYWVNHEVQTKPNQGILLYGGSMGAATMMSVLAKPIPKNVKGIIENCGFQSIDEQLRYTYTNLVAPALENIPVVDLDIVADQAHEDQYMQLLKENYFDQELHLNPTENLPILGMSQTDIPKLLIHGTEDNVVPVSNAQNLYGLSKGYKDLVLINGAGHGEAQKVDPATYNQHVSDFLAVVFNDQVKVRYLDEQNQSLLPDEEVILSGFYGDTYQTEAKTFDQYQLASIDGAEQGIFNETVPVVTYTYQKITSSTSDSSTTSDDSETAMESSSSQPLATSNTNAEMKKDTLTSTTQASLKSYPKTGEKKATLPSIFGGLIIVMVGVISFWQKRR